MPSDFPRPLIDVGVLHDNLQHPDWVILDARFDLAAPAAGRTAYLAAHVPGAVYMDLDADLSGPPLTDHGRHPLPGADALCATFGGAGIGPGTRVVVYDDGPGAHAARAWWLLRYMGHAAVAVLDGGWRAWRDAGLPTRDGAETRPPAAFAGTPRGDWLVTLAAVAGVPRLVDARDPARFRGEHEPLDRVPGHIPGAVNHFFGHNLGPDGRFLAPAALRAAWQRTLAGVPVESAVMYCGSGVTACHNLLALERAGLGTARLYAGSYSEWSRDPDRPIATGDA